MRALFVAWLVVGMGAASGCEQSPEISSATETAIDGELTDESQEAQVVMPDTSGMAIEMAASGEIADVDTNQSTFRLVLDDGSSTTFQYTELTEITGTSGTQGLLARRGSRAVVYYDDGTAPPTATAVEVLVAPDEISPEAGPALP